MRPASRLDGVMGWDASLGKVSRRGERSRRDGRRGLDNASFGSHQEGRGGLDEAALGDDGARGRRVWMMQLLKMLEEGRGGLDDSRG